MKYMGSKNRHAKELLPIMLKDRKENQYFVDVFAGGMNIIDKVENPRIANDNHYYLIELFKAIQNGWEPPDFISEEQYNDIRKFSDKYSPELVGFVGFGCSYSGKWWGGFARGNNETGEPRNYCLESKKNILKQATKLKGVIFYNNNYLDLKIPDNSIIYNDPPYFGTTEYKYKINYKEFWGWCENLSESGHKVFVSEYNAPINWKCIWQKSVFNSLTKETGSKTGIEKLFIHEK